METIIQTMPGYRLNEYMLVLSPHEDLRKRIQSVKKEFAEKFKCPQAIWGKPHMMLARFSQLEMMEERITKQIAIDRDGISSDQSGDEGFWILSDTFHFYPGDFA